MAHSSAFYLAFEYLLLNLLNRSQLQKGKTVRPQRQDDGWTQEVQATLFSHFKFFTLRDDNLSSLDQSPELHKSRLILRKD